MTRYSSVVRLTGRLAGGVEVDAEVELAQLTVILGRNASGKSVVARAAARAAASRVCPAESRYDVLNATLVRGEKLGYAMWLPASRIAAAELRRDPRTGYWCPGEIYSQLAARLHTVNADILTETLQWLWGTLDWASRELGVAREELLPLAAWPVGGDLRLVDARSDGEVDLREAAAGAYSAAVVVAAAAVADAAARLGRPPLLAVEEPQLGLHPAASAAVSALLGSLAARAPVVVASTSPAVAAALAAGAARAGLRHARYYEVRVEGGELVLEEVEEPRVTRLRLASEATQ